MYHLRDVTGRHITEVYNNIITYIKYQKTNIYNNTKYKYAVDNVCIYVFGCVTRPWK